MTDKPGNTGEFTPWRALFDRERELIEKDLSVFLKVAPKMTSTAVEEVQTTPTQKEPDTARNEQQAASNAHTKAEVEQLQKVTPKTFHGYEFNNVYHEDTPDEGLESERVERNYLTGLCLSGGGVRSAVVSMGILNRLAERGMLRHFDYLTSVSGGGYAGAAVSHWQAERKRAALHGEDAAKTKEIPFDTSHGATHYGFAALYRDFVRRNVSYLVPGGASGFYKGLFVVMRAILLNLFIWLLISALVFMFIMLPGHIGISGETLTQAADSSSSAFANLTNWTGMEWRNLNDRVFLAALSLSLGIALSLALTMMYFSIMSFLVYSSPPKAKTIFTYKYSRRRHHEWLGGLLLRLFLVFAIFGTLPFVVDNLDRALGMLPGVEKSPSDGNRSIVGTVFTLIGIGSAAFTYYKEKLDAALTGSNSILIIAGSIFFVYGIAILAYLIAAQVWLGECGLPNYLAFDPNVPVDRCDSDHSLVVLSGLTALAFILAFAVNINDVSLGRFYRDRLMETFLPDREAVEGLETTPKAAPPEAKFADTCRLVDLSSQRPLHLVCANVMPTWLGDRKARERLGDSFVMSRLFCGSDITGFQTTDRVAHGNLRLATAMAASGAAANPRGGFSGKGPTAARPTAIAMSLLALRLGYWLAWDNPVAKRQGNKYGNHFSPSLMSTLSQMSGTKKLASKSGFIEVTDGGHFENLGLYELVRRRCGLIVVCDGGSDPEASYDSFTSALHRIKSDFGATVSFDIDIDSHGDRSNLTDMRRSGPEQIVSRPDDRQFPKGTDYADRGFFLARVKYNAAREPEVSQSETHYEGPKDGRRHHTKGPKEGLLIYLKSAMLRELEHTTKGYRGANPEFPFDSTANQFFTPEQFDAYLNVGETITNQMLGKTHLDRLFKRNGERPTLERLLMNHYFQKQGPIDD